MFNLAGHEVLGVTLETYLDGLAERDWRSTEAGTVSFALIGLGWWVREQVVPALEASELCDTTVLVSSSTEKAERVAAATGAAAGINYEEFHDGAASDEYDAVYVCTPNAVHLPYVRTAAELDKAVLCEKPMEASVERAEEMTAVCADHDVPLMVAYRLQTAPAARRARELVADGAIGEPVHVLSENAQMLLSLIPDPDQWRLDPEMTGYGTSVMDIGVYSINTARYLLDSDPVAVQATMDSHDAAFDDVPDERAAFTVTFEDGTLAACTTSQNAQSSSSLRITGTEGRIHLEPAFHMETGLRVRRGETEATFDTPETNQMTAVFDHFADRILTGSGDFPDGEHGLVDMRTLAAIYEAAETGRRTVVGDG